MRRVTALMLCLAMTFSSAPALAVDDAMAPSEIEARIAELEAKQRDIDVRGPTTGTFVGAGLTAAGLSLGAATAITCGESGACSPEHIIGLGVSAVLLSAVGIGVLVPSSRRLRARKHERQAIQEEIRALEARRAQSALRQLRIGLIPGEQSRLTIGWVY
ncbi:hypothetical protein K2X89_11780 [Myxococcota bacterium]|nr:hypothetical protein [Myxococcota bacterium]